jgi:plastocyanin
LQFHRNISLNVFKRELAMRMFPWRLVLVMAIAVLLPSYPKSASATMVNVSVGPGGNLVFDPASITINPGDQVKWTWASSGHSTTSGSPGMPNNLWDSGIHNEGATFTRTFNSAGTFPYYCTPHGGCCGMVGTVTVVNASPTPNPTPTPTPIGSATPTSILANISTRSFVQTTDNVMIGGFIVQGTQAKRVIIRAIGPELTPFGVPNVLANPTLELHDGTGNLIGFNDDWQTTVIGGVITQNQVQDIVASGKAPTDTRESAIIADLPAGNYTAIVRGVSSTTGVALVEVYDLVPEADSILANISTRSLVQTTDNVMIGGFIVQGTQPKMVIIRAIGPELTPFGVPNVLANPMLELHNGTGGLIASNDN